MFIDALKQTNELAVLLLSEQQICCVQDILVQLEEKPHQHPDTSIYWMFDSMIGGIGGYLLPNDPNINPFPGGIKRTLYRPLQYAKSKIIYYRSLVDQSEDIFKNCGQHLEAVTKYYHSSQPRFQRLTLKPLTEYFIKKEKNLDSNFIKAFTIFYELNNIAKHDVNQDENRLRGFLASDALVGYFSARILGMAVLNRVK